ncbi:glycosyl hydrolase family 16 [Polaribacter sp. HL-MS24]|uniref:glycosyl hydrolase family 16 n=1 Tax=Polaribacter sp. HL-MS24 TaxID=3077735 RepID=UPI0029347219|nr:glycosyl hydrolase family 16 [Polaribacter sp. HL-MS24]WOC40411.1 glycosyl hydrolase family 16 [Polaribacter sp. HL-MS24]
MKTKKQIQSKITFLLGLILLTTIACERELSEDVVEATFTLNPEVYIDGFSAGLEYYPYLDSKFDAFSVDTEVKYSGASSMRFDVPNVGDPSGAYAGAIFRDDNGGRDLSGYDALTFWAKSSTAATINDIGFGQDFGENKFQVSKRGLRLSTNWVKYIIPIPNPSELHQESGMFWYAEGPENDNGYTFWIDELKYEKLGTIAQPRPSILNGDDIVVNSFIGVKINITDLNQTFHLDSGQNTTVSAAPGYFTFTSSDPSVASVSEFGEVLIETDGQTIITASLNGIEAEGSLTINSVGSFSFAPTPSRSPEDVTSIFSNHYTNTPVDFFNGYWQPYQTTQSADFSIDGDDFLNYTNFNFVGIQFANPTVDATEKSNLHFNMYIPDAVPSNFDFLVTVIDFGPDKVNGGGDDTKATIICKKISENYCRFMDDN